jgi:hypothetical protein
MEKPTQKKVSDSWDNYVSGNFLKAVNVQSENDAFVCIAIQEYEQDGSIRPRLTLERNGNEWDFDLNKTNAQKCVELGIVKPTDLIGKKLFFKKALVRNPKTNKEVDSLRLHRIE